MSELLKKLKLKDSFEIEIPIEQDLFVERLTSIVDKGDTSIFSNISDVFSSSKNDYRGMVSNNSFSLKRKRKMFDMNINFAVAKGEFKQEIDQLKIKTDINAFNGPLKVFFFIIPVFYCVFLSAFFFSSNKTESIQFVFVPFIIVHASFMLGIPYMMMRKSVGKMKKELERELYFLTKK